MKDLLRRPWFGPLVALVLVYALFAVASPDTFARPENLATMLRQTVVVAIASVGMTYVIVAGGIDLSVGSLVALTTVVVAKVLAGGASPLVAVAAGVALATVAGVVNGTLVAKLGITPFIVTLGTMSALRGAAKGIANEQKIDVQSAGLDTLMAPTSSVWLPPAGVWVAAVTALLFAGMLRYTVFGRHVVAIGSNEETARLCGIRVPRVTIWVYALAGALAGLAGLMEFSTLTVGDPTDSIGLELEVIAAVVVGGTSLMGGQGRIFGTLIGAFIISVIKNGMNLTNVDPFNQKIVLGAVLTAAVLFDTVKRRGFSS